MEAPNREAALNHLTLPFFRDVYIRERFQFPQGDAPLVLQNFQPGPDGRLVATTVGFLTRFQNEIFLVGFEPKQPPMVLALSPEGGIRALFAGDRANSQMLFDYYRSYEEGNSVKKFRDLGENISNLVYDEHFPTTAVTTSTAQIAKLAVSRLLQQAEEKLPKRKQKEIRALQQILSTTPTVIQDRMLSTYAQRISRDVQRYGSSTPFLLDRQRRQTPRLASPATPKLLHHETGEEIQRGAAITPRLSSEANKPQVRIPGRRRGTPQITPPAEKIPAKPKVDPADEWLNSETPSQTSLSESVNQKVLYELEPEDEFPVENVIVYTTKGINNLVAAGQEEIDVKGNNLTLRPSKAIEAKLAQAVATEIEDFNQVHIKKLDNGGLELIIDSPHGIVNIRHETIEERYFEYTSPKNPEPERNSRRSRSYILVQDSTYRALSQLLETIYATLQTRKQSKSAKTFEQLLASHLDFKLL